MAITAHGRQTKLALDKLAVRYALLAAKREVEGASVGDPEAQQEQSELDKLIRLAGQAVEDQPDPIRTLADIIKITAESDADPYLTMGVLIEGAVHTLATQIPDERREDTAAAALQFFVDRLRASVMPDSR